MPTLTRSQLLAYALAAVIVVVLGVRFMHGQAGTGSGAAASAADGAGASAADGAGASAADGGGASGADESAPDGGGAPTSVQIERPDATALVHVAGAVRRPGVYRLHVGDRVKDAVGRAGGAKPGADANAINLAAKIADGQQIVVPKRGAAGSTQVAAAGPTDGASQAPQAPVSLNSANAEQLETLDGVGPATAQKILDWRQQHGGFRTVDDLAEVPGIGPKRLAALKPKVQL
jgi:competence protein ComEA